MARGKIFQSSPMILHLFLGNNFEVLASQDLASGAATLGPLTLSQTDFLRQLGAEIKTTNLKFLERIAV